MHLICCGYRLATVQYFLDEMQHYEIATLIDGINYADISGWEQCRMQIYTLSSMFSKKQIKPTDVLHFKWDKEQDKETTEISNDDVERLRQKAEQIRLINYGW